MQNKIIRPVKPVGKTSFKPRQKVINTSSNNIGNKAQNNSVSGNNLISSSNNTKLLDAKTNRLEMNKMHSNKENAVNNGK